MATNTQRIAIVGVDESDQIGRVENKSSLQHHAEAAFNALEDAGLEMNEVDGLLSAGFSNLTLAEYLGIHPKFTDGTSVGGSSFIIHIAHAIAAIRAGYCEVALVTHGEAGRSARNRAGANGSEPGPQFEVLDINSLDEMAMASPAIVGDRLIIRTRSKVYSIRKPASDRE